MSREFVLEALFDLLCFFNDNDNYFDSTQTLDYWDDDRLALFVRYLEQMRQCVESVRTDKGAVAPVVSER